MDVVILTRVSKDSQSYDRQIEDLRNFASIKQYNIVGEFNEKISGASKNEDRVALNALHNLIENIEVNKILIWELSRLGRNTLEVLKSLEVFHDKGISLYIHNYNIETLNDDGSINPMAQILVTLLAEFSRVERTAIQQRLASGYRKHIDSGGKVGRVKNVSMTKDQLLEKHKDILKYLNKGRSIRETAMMVGKSTRTVLKVKFAFESGK
jgi:DNA invertase Pin-like site-specific DNA recombinase